MNYPLTETSNGKGSPAKKTKPELTQAQLGAISSDTRQLQVVFQTVEGIALRGVPARITQHGTVFELYSADLVPKFSESLKDFQIVGPEGILYSGRAVVDNLVSDGIKVTCEVSLDEYSWSNLIFNLGEPGRKPSGAGLAHFFQGWQKLYLVEQDYKVAIADLQTFMVHLRQWLGRAEIEISRATVSDRSRRADEFVLELRTPVLDALDSLYEQFEVVSERIAPSARPAHRAYGRQQLHPLILGSPFMHRTFTKPLGYAGDYEMMNMIVRNGLEGNSVFAKLINAHLLDQPPCHAVRNRVDFLNSRIIEEAGRVALRGGIARVYCVACGPAWEVVNFVAEHPLADKVVFELLDFNEETLRRTGEKLNQTIHNHHRQTKVKLVKNSIQNLLRSMGKRSGEFDLIYCSGLYDYLSDAVSQALNNYLYDMLASGGLLVVGNFATGTSGRNLMEHLMDWFLIYRDPRELLALAPQQANLEYCRVRSEFAAANLFLEARKVA